jgi:hypothetical protein
MDNPMFRSTFPRGNRLVADIKTSYMFCASPNAINIPTRIIIQSGSPANDPDHIYIDIGKPHPDSEESLDQGDDGHAGGVMTRAQAIEFMLAISRMLNWKPEDAKNDRAGPT